MSKAAKLAQAAKSAAEVRAYQTDPNVAALQIERVRTAVTVIMWAAVFVLLTFTMTNVQAFVAGGASQHGKSAPQWYSAWLFEPGVSGLVVSVLIAEQALSRYKVKSGGWVRALKWAALASTYAMNTWQSWFALDAAGIAKHSIPPVLVALAAEAVTAVRHRMTEAVQRAYDDAVARSQARSQDHADPVSETVPGPVLDGPQDRSPAVPETVPGPLESGPQDHAEMVPGPVPVAVQDRSQDRDEAVLDDTRDRSPKRSQDRRRTTAKAAPKGRVTQAEWEDRIRQAVADHPGIDLNPSPIAAVLNLDTKTRASGGFKRAVTVVREENDAADHQLRAVNE